MSHEAFVKRLWEERALAILRADQQDVAARAMEAAVRGGFAVVEFTMRTPGAVELVREFARQPGLLVGAGTVLRVEEARAAVRAGAGFLVSPVLDPEVMAAARDLGVPMVPGCFTPTELWAAHQAGAPVQKLFPAAAAGPAYVSALLAPMPFLRIVPTQGVDATLASAYLEAGVWAAGFTGTLFAPDDLAAERHDRIEARARELLAAAREAKRPPAE